MVVVLSMENPILYGLIYGTTIADSIEDKARLSSHRLSHATYRKPPRAGEKSLGLANTLVID